RHRAGTRARSSRRESARRPRLPGDRRAVAGRVRRRGHGQAQGARRAHEGEPRHPQGAGEAAGDGALEPRAVGDGRARPRRGQALPGPHGVRQGGAPGGQAEGERRGPRSLSQEPLRPPSPARLRARRAEGGPGGRGHGQARRHPPAGAADAAPRPGAQGQGLAARMRALTLLLLGAAATSLPDRGWPTHGGDPGHQQYSPLAQIHRGNVKTLQVAWTYKSGGASPDNRSQIQCNPIVVDGVLYATSPRLQVFALDAATGRELWTFDPFASASGVTPHALGVNRGVVFRAKGEDRRILFTAGQRLFALDAATGKLVGGFGTGGSVSLLDGLGRDVTGLYVLSNTPGALYRDLLILGTRVSEGPGASAPGHVRA